MDIYRGGKFPKNLGYYITAYGIAVKHGFVGTEEEWLASLKGEAGTPTEMRYNAELQQLEWKLKTSDEWTGVLPLATIRGEAFDEAVQTVKQTKESAVNEVERLKGEAVAEVNSLKGQTVQEVTALKESFAGEIATTKADAIKKIEDVKQTAIQVVTESKAQAEQLITEKAEEVREKTTEANASAQTARSEAAKAGEMHARVTQTASEVREAKEVVSAARQVVISAKEEVTQKANEVHSNSLRAMQARGEAEGMANEAQLMRNQAENHAEKAKEYAQQAQNIAGGGVTSFNGRGGAVLPQAIDYAPFYLGKGETAKNSEKLGGKVLNYFATAQSVNNLGQVIDTKAGRTEVANLSREVQAKASTQEVADLRQTVNQKATELQELSRKVGVLEQGGGGSSGFEVAEARYNNNTFVISNFQAKENVAFLMRVVSVQQDSLAIDEHTQVQIENTYMPFKNFNGEPFFEQVATNGEVQRAFVCIRKGSEVWADALPTKILKKINDIEGKVSEATEQANRAFQSANNAKEMLVGAIIGMGGSASTSESFSELIKQYKERTEYTIITQPKIPILQVGDNRSLTRKYFIFDKVVRVEDGRTLLLFRLPARMENRLKSYEKMTVRLELGEASSNFNRVRIYMTYENGDAIKEIAEVTRSDFDEGGLSCTKEIYTPFAGPLVQSATNYRIAVEVEGVMRSVNDAIEAETRLLGNDVYEFRIWFS